MAATVGGACERCDRDLQRKHSGHLLAQILDVERGQTEWVALVFAPRSFVWACGAEVLAVQETRSEVRESASGQDVWELS